MSNSEVTAPATPPLHLSDDPGDNAKALELACALQELDKDAVVATAYKNYGGPPDGFYGFLARAMVRPGGTTALDAIARAPAFSLAAGAETIRQARSMAFLQSIGAPIAVAALQANGMASSTCPCTSQEPGHDASGLLTPVAASPPSPSGSSGSSGSSMTPDTAGAGAAATPSAPCPGPWSMPHASNSAGVDAAAAPSAAGSTSF